MGKVELVNKKGEHFYIRTENLTNAEHVSIYHGYINTPIQMEAPTTKEAIEKRTLSKNIRWANALQDFSETLMSKKLRRDLQLKKS